MAIAKTASVTIAEMREFASFTAAEQRYIRRSLDIGLGRCDAFRVWGRNARENAAIRSQYVAYQELKALRHAIPCETGFDAIEGFIGKLTRVAAFDRSALILRLYGRGRAVLPQDDEWNALAAQFSLLPGTRQIFVIDIDSVQTSCGWGVPMMELQHERETLQKYHRQADPVEWTEKFKGRTRSIDGLPTRPTDRYIAGDA